MNGDADSSHMLKRSCKVFPLSGNVKALHLLRKKKKKKSCAEVAKVYNNKSSNQEIVKKGNNCQFAAAPQTTIVMATVCGECFRKMEKALNLYNMIF